MAFIAGTAIAMVVLLVVVLLSLRKRPFYLSLWLSTWTILLGCSGVTSCIVVTLMLKWRKIETHGIPYSGPPGAEFWILALLVVVAMCFLVSAISAFCVVPPRSTWPQRLFTNIMEIVALTLLGLILLVGGLALMVM